MSVRATAVALATVCLCVAAGAARPSVASEGLLHLDETPSPPVWPASYSVRYVFSLPHTKTIQKHGIRYPVAVFRDMEKGRSRVEFSNGTDTLISVGDTMYEVVPRIDKMQCLVTAEEANGGDSNALPDLTDYEFDGKTEYKGILAYKWTYKTTHLSKDTVYEFLSCHKGHPLRLRMHGKDSLSGSHYDEWELAYEPASYVAGPPSDADALFAVPALCQGVAPIAADSPRALRHRAMWATAFPRLPTRGTSPAGGGAAYEAFRAAQGGAARRLASREERSLRAAAFDANLRRIEEHNADPGRGFDMAANRFADWTAAELAAAFAPRSDRRAARNAAALARMGAGGEEESSALLREFRVPHANLSDPALLPGEFSWRGSLVDARVVKDQASCGSCWSFGAMGGMEAAWFMATRERVSLSEQQLMDCAWGADPADDGSAAACDGGDAAVAISYVAKRGGAASTEEYEYEGRPGWCRLEGTAVAARIKGFSRLPRYDDQAIKEALVTRGPLTVAMDASWDSIAFYSGGIYQESRCMSKPADLDHSVMLVGYGRDPVQGAYWLIRNSWGDLWGDREYVKVSAEGGACGITADALYAVADA